MTDWEAAVRPGGRIGHAIEAHERIGSTNDRARAALEQVGGEGRVILAELQLKGRGRRGRTWQSPPGVNLTLSVGLRPRVDATAAGLLGIAVALAVHSAALQEAELLIRWPNDLVAANGLKVAGLLLETAFVDEHLVHAVIGIGINVNWPRDAMPDAIAATATSLADQAGHAIDRVALLGRLLTALDNEIAALERGEAPIGRYRELSWLDGRHVAVSLGDREVEGTALGVNEAGCLILQTDVGRLALSVGEVLRVRDARAAVA